MPEHVTLPVETVAAKILTAGGHQLIVVENTWPGGRAWVWSDGRRVWLTSELPQEYVGW